MTVTAEEFLRRFMLHVLPRRFVRIRFSGFLANRRRRQLLPLRQLLLEATPQQPSETPEAARQSPPQLGSALAVVAPWWSARNSPLTRSAGDLLTGSLSLTVRSWHSVSNLQRATARAFYVCPYGRQRAPFAAKRGPFKLPGPLMPPFSMQGNTLSTRTGRKLPVPDVSKSIEYP